MNFISPSRVFGSFNWKILRSFNSPIFVRRDFWKGSESFLGPAWFTAISGGILRSQTRIFIFPGQFSEAGQILAVGSNLSKDRLNTGDFSNYVAYIEFWPDFCSSFKFFYLQRVFTEISQNFAVADTKVLCTQTLKFFQSFLQFFSQIR